MWAIAVKWLIVLPKAIKYRLKYPVRTALMKFLTSMQAKYCSHNFAVLDESFRISL